MTPAEIAAQKVADLEELDYVVCRNGCVHDNADFALARESLVRAFLAGVAWQQAHEVDDEPDITVWTAPWTDAQVADMRALALRADLKTARMLLEMNGYIVQAHQT